MHVNSVSKVAPGCGCLRGAFWAPGAVKSPLRIIIILFWDPSPGASALLLMVYYELVVCTVDVSGTVASELSLQA